MGNVCTESVSEPVDLGSVCTESVANMSALGLTLKILNNEVMEILEDLH